MQKKNETKKKKLTKGRETKKWKSFYNFHKLLYYYYGRKETIINKLLRERERDQKLEEAYWPGIQVSVCLAIAMQSNHSS